MNIFTKIKTAVGVTLFVFFCMFSAALFKQGTHTVFAQLVGLPYGGFAVWTFVCPCSPEITLITFAPGFIGEIPDVFQVTYYTGSQIFAYWTTGFPGVWSLGGAEFPQQCWVESPVSGCNTVGFPIIHILPYSGSSL